MREFTPEKFFQDENSVVVFGKDEAIVKLTGKKYNTDWVHNFTFKDKKITHVQVLIDTLALAKAFQP